MFLTKPSPLEEICDHPGRHQGIRWYVKRDDLLHPEIQGNKWRKLQPWLQKLKHGNYEGVLTYGGAFSNHIEAVSRAGALFDFITAAIIRGSYVDLHNTTLGPAARRGMALFPVPKVDFDQKSGLVDAIRGRFSQYLEIPEGGYGPEAAAYCREIVREAQQQLPAIHSTETVWWSASAGTGCMAWGMLQALPENHILRLYPALSPELLFSEARETLLCHPSVAICADYILGGYARTPPEYLDFVNFFHKKTGILPDPVYTGKMFYGIHADLEKGVFPPEAVIVSVHSGGLQGWGEYSE